MRFSQITVLFVLSGILIPLVSSCDLLQGNSSPEVFTMEQVYLAPITSIVEETITLETEMTWSHYTPDWDGVEGDTLFVTQMAINFKNADQFIEEERFQGQGRGNIFVNSTNIVKYVDENNKEQYFFDGKRLYSDTTYHLTGEFHFREWLDVDEELLNNPEFIEQSNDVVYWRQTFEFVPTKTQLVE